MQQVQKFGKQFGVGQFTNPFDRIKGINQTRMKGWPFWTLMIVNIPVLLAGLAIVALELATLITHGVQLKGNEFHDSRSYALFIFDAPVIAAGAVGVAASLVGALVMTDFWGQVVVAAALGGLSLLGFGFTIFTQVISWGRLNGCISGSTKNLCTADCTLSCAPLNNDGAIAKACEGCVNFCKDEKGPLIAVSVITLVLMLLCIPNMFIALMFLVHRKTQLMAAGFNKEQREEVLSSSQPAVEYNRILKDKFDAIQNGILVKQKKGYTTPTGFADSDSAMSSSPSRSSAGIMSTASSFGSSGANGAATTTVYVRPVHHGASK